MASLLHTFDLGADEQQLSASTMRHNIDPNEIVVDAGNVLVHDHDVLYEGLPTLRHYAPSGGSNCWRIDLTSEEGFIEVVATFRADADSSATCEQLEIRDTAGDLMCTAAWRAGWEWRLAAATEQQLPINTIQSGAFHRIVLAANGSGSAKPGWDTAANGGLGAYSQTAIPNGKVQLRFYATAEATTPQYVFNDDPDLLSTTGIPDYVTDGNKIGTSRNTPVWEGAININDEGLVGPLLRPSTNPSVVTALPIHPGDTVELTAGSTAPPGCEIESRLWEKESGPTTTLNSETAENPTLTAPAELGTVVYKVRSRTRAQFWSEYEFVSFEVTAPPANTPPTAGISATPNTLNTGIVTIDVTGTDPDGTVASATLIPPAGVSVTQEPTPPPGVVGRWYFDVTPYALGSYEFRAYVTDNEGANSSQVATTVSKVAVGESVGETLFHRFMDQVPEGAAYWELEVRVRNADGTPAAAANIDTVGVIGGDDDTYRPGGQQENTTFIIERADPIRWDDNGFVIEYGPWKVIHEGFQVPPDENFEAAVVDREGMIGSKYRAFSVTQMEEV